MNTSKRRDQYLRASSLLQPVIEESERRLSQKRIEIRHFHGLEVTNSSLLAQTHLDVLCADAEALEEDIASLKQTAGALRDIGERKEPLEALDLYETSRGRPAYDFYYDRNLKLAAEVGALVKAGQTAKDACAAVAKSTSNQISARVARNAWQKYHNEVDFQSELLFRLSSKKNK